MTGVPAEAKLWDLLRGAMATKALGIAADLRIASALAAGARPVNELAQVSGADPETLQRILRALVSEGVFAEDEPRVFRNTEASELLGRDGWTEFALVIDSVVAGGNEPQGSEWLDLLMLVLGGRERTAAEWRALLETAGFGIDEIDDGLIQASCR